MSLSHFLHPVDVVHRPQLEPEVKRAILASRGMAAPLAPGLDPARGPAEWLQEGMAAPRTLDGGAA